MNVTHTINCRSRLKAVALLAFGFLILSSCTQESYESGDGEYSLMKAEFVDAHTNGESKLVNVMTDDGDSLILTKPMEYKWASTADSTYRALLYYNKVGDKAEPIAISSVPTPAIHITSELKEEAKTDPVKFVSSWKSRNRRYLNLGLILLTGSTDKDITQKIGLLLQYGGVCKHQSFPAPM